MKWVITDAEGIVLSCSNRGPVPDGGAEVETAMSILDLAQSQIIEGVPVLRPAGPDIVSDGTTHTVMDCPIGTLIEVCDLLGDEISTTFSVETADDDVQLWGC